MNDATTNTDQAHEDILAFTVSDEALEAAAGGVVAKNAASLNPVPPHC